jgi:hypothetical protein
MFTRSKTCKSSALSAGLIFFAQGQKGTAPNTALLNAGYVTEDTNPDQSK